MENNKYCFPDKYIEKISINQSLSTYILQYIYAVSAPQVQPLVPAATYNIVFMSLSS